jgi:hypothetical protein
MRMGLSLNGTDVITVSTEITVPRGCLAGTKAFYQKLLGLPVLGENKSERGPSVA